MRKRLKRFRLGVGIQRHREPCATQKESKLLIQYHCRLEDQDVYEEQVA
jgi:hypothetical protein